ncbi:hydantoin racemase [Grosmannia clavigera kw1407]|uniref:Hydantoin racemase n=1 Tax=Grosmannia clavigera (strain kw1407 / UAMH 11150) TaxID=655863 RepID=F0XAW0_GROCL|nr:hydantoin racemase [Grosmannia clavigera kw1407]EFX05141.1 hydantoin racemase [Grosmannia clavigera kw1407]
MTTLSDLPSVTGTSSRHINVLLINPNSTKAMTESCLRSVQGSLAPNVHVFGFTGPTTGPTAVEGRVDAAISAVDCFRALQPLLREDAAVQIDAFLVACFSAHPLIAMLREEYAQPCIGIMEAALYAARMCGDKLGIVTTSERSSTLHGRSVVADYGFQPHVSAGGETGHVSVLELESKPRDIVYTSIQAAARRLVYDKGADCICMGCAGMTEMRQACIDAVGRDVDEPAGGHGRRAMVIDGVTMGVHFLSALVTEDLGTAKGGAYRSSAAGRARRGQTYV